MPYCPECRDEYREGFTQCAECGAALVDTLPPEPETPAETGEGTHGGWDQVAETSQIYEADMIALRLTEAGIENQIVDQTFEQAPLPNNRDLAVVRVLVPVARAEEAKRLLAETPPLPEDAESEPEPPGGGGPSEPPNS